jgi:hypothetical protein
VVYTFRMSSNGTAVARPEHRQAVFAVRYIDGTSAHILVPPELGIYGPSPPVMRMARKLQADGEIPAGEIVGLVRVREVPIVPGRSGALGPPTDPTKRSMRG